MVNGKDIFNVHWPNSLGLIEGFCTVCEQQFGHAKTKLLYISSLPKATRPSTVQVKSKPIAVAETQRHLGIIFSHDLRWNHHAADLIAKASRKAGLLKWMSKELPSPVIKKLYTQYVRPSLEYASRLFSGKRCPAT